MHKRNYLDIPLPYPERMQIGPEAHRVGLVDVAGVTLRVGRLPLTAAQRLRALELLSGAEAERQRRNPSDGFLLGRLLLRELVAELSGAPARITAVCPECGEEHGRPVSDVLSVSVAHAGDVVVVAAAGTPVGVDVEPADAEVPAVFGGSVTAWTRLEAVLKADGRGVVVDPGEVRFTDTGTAAGTATIGPTTYAVETTAAFGDTAADPGYVISVAREVPSARAIPQKTGQGVRR